MGIGFLCFFLVVLPSILFCLFSIYREKGHGVGWMGRRGGPEKSLGKGSVIRIYYMKAFFFLIEKNP